MCGIYKITNLINKKVYIGQSTNIHKRMIQHKNRYVREKCSEYNSELYKDMREFGINNFTFEIIEECPKDELNLKEIYWIKYYSAYECGYNKNEGGNSGTHVKLTNKDLDEIRKLLKETELTNTEIGELFNVSENAISGINTGYRWYNNDCEYPLRKNQMNGGLEKTEYHNECPICGKEKVRNSSVCKDCYNKYVRKRKVEMPSKEEITNVIKKLKGNLTAVGKYYGVSYTSIKRWLKKMNMPFHSKDYRQPKKQKQESPEAKPLYQIDKITGEIIAVFKSVYEAEQVTKIEHISTVCNGKRKTAGGYKWAFIEQSNA